jgi:alkyl sulfatase BDS1-like metallo-beta-lactamase superfamily hydrolase
MAVGRWAARSPSLPREAGLGVDSAMLSFRTMFSPAAATGLHATIELRLGDHRFRAEVDDGALALERGEADRPDAVVETDSNTLAGMAYGGYPLDSAIEAGAVRLVGDRAAFAGFLRCFPLPPTAEGPAPGASEVAAARLG